MVTQGGSWSGLLVLLHLNPSRSLLYWVGKIHSGFSIICYGKPGVNLMSTQCLGKSSPNSDHELALKDGLDGAHPPFICHYLPSLHDSCWWSFSGAQTGQALTTL